MLEALGVGAVRPRSSCGNTVQRPGGDAAVRAHRGRAEGAGADHRRDAALLRGRSVRGRQAGGRRSAGATSPRSARRRSPSPTISISAIPSGRRSWASSSAASAASARPARRSTSRSCPATSRSTTRPTAVAILPTPSIGGVGLHRRFHQATATIAFKAEGEAILLIGETAGWLGQSVYLREICGREEGRAAAGRSRRRARERRLRARPHRERRASAPCHDLSDGGLLVALAEMAMASGIGAALDDAPTRVPPMPFWFGEDQARYRRHGAARRRRPPLGEGGEVRGRSCRSLSVALVARRWRSPASLVAVGVAARCL